MAKNIYIGTVTDIPVYEDQTVTISNSNIQTYFSVAHTNSGFTGTDTVFTSANTKATIITTTLTALTNMSSISFDYAYMLYGYLFSNDSFTITVNGTKIFDKTMTMDPMSTAETGSYTGSLEKGQTIVFSYEKKTSGTSGSTYYCNFSNMRVTTSVQTGTEQKEVAHPIGKAYIGINNKAHLGKRAYIGVDGKAKLCWGTLCGHTSLGTVSYSWAATDYSTCTATATCLSCNEVLTETVNTTKSTNYGHYCTSDDYYRYTANFSYLTTTPQTKDVIFNEGYSSHKYDSGTVTKEATCTSSGTIKYECTRSGCPKTKTETIPASHNYAEVWSVAASCEIDGCITWGCDACGDSYDEIIPALGHNYDYNTIENSYVAPSCDFWSYTEHKCKRCGSITQKYSSIGPHWYVKGEIVIPTKDTYYWTCKLCGKEVKSVGIPSDGIQVLS